MGKPFYEMKDDKLKLYVDEKKVHETSCTKEGKGYKIDGQSYGSVKEYLKKHCEDKVYDFDDFTSSESAVKGHYRFADNKSQKQLPGKVPEEYYDDDEDDEDAQRKRKADKDYVAESLGVIFDGEELSENFKEQTITLFKAALNERVNEEVREIENRLIEELHEEFEDYKVKTEQKVNEYLSYVVQEWMNENEMQLESTFKVSTAESLFLAVQEVLQDHGLIKLNEEENSTLTKVEEKYNELAQKYETLFERYLDMKDRNMSLERDITFESVCFNLSESDKGRMRTLSAGMAMDNVNEYEKILNALLSTHFSGVNEEYNRFDEDVAIDLKEDTRVRPFGDPNDKVQFYSKILSKT